MVSKRYYIILGIVLLAFCPIAVMAQAPQRVSYQGMLMRLDGNPAGEITIGVRLSVLRGSEDGSVVYRERHHPTTTRSGLFYLQLGMGESEMGGLEIVDWSNGPYYLRSEIDSTGEEEYQIEAVEQLVSVPYALYCNSSDSAIRAAKVNDVIHALMANNMPGIEDTMMWIHAAYDTMGNGMDLRLNAAFDDAAVIIDNWMNDTTVPLGATKGLFTVAPGRRVRFAQGNLQYCDSTRTFRFANKQYNVLSIVGNACATDGYSEWKDRFGWGTSGWSGAGMVFQPCASPASGEATDFGPEGVANLTGENVNADWGKYNAIENGGGRAGRWRLLSSEEWKYLMFYRKCSTVGANANARFFYANVGNVFGVVLIPDEFTVPVDISLPETINDPMLIRNYSYSTWRRLELNGFVFIPMSKVQIEPNRMGTYVGYWTSTAESESKAYTFYFYNTGAFPAIAAEDRNHGCAVRLVRDE